MNPISRSTGLISLTPYFPKFQEIFKRTDRHYLDYPAIVRLDHSKRTRATNIHDILVRYAREIFEGVPNVFLRKIRGLFLVEVAGMLVRFQKVGKSGKLRIPVTQQGNLFSSQEFEQLHIVGIPPATNVVAAYQEDSFEHSMSACLMVCPIGNSVSWTIDIHNPFEVQEKLPVISPVKKQKKTGRAKKAPKDIKAEGNGNL